jgi:hypothetical protein
MIPEIPAFPASLEFLALLEDCMRDPFSVDVEWPGRWVEFHNLLRFPIRGSVSFILNQPQPRWPCFFSIVHQLCVPATQPDSVFVSSRVFRCNKFSVSPWLIIL